MKKSGQKAKAQSLSSEPIYYENGNLYGYSSNYDSSFPCYKKTSFEEFYLGATQSVSAKDLLNVDFSLVSADVSLVIKKQSNASIQYVV